jgi:hypothetical protein
MNEHFQRQKEARKRLYDEVWAQPMVKVAKSYGVSDVAVKKWCKRLNIPTPGLGYWAKVQHGKKVKQTPLPSISDEEFRPLAFRFPIPLDKPTANEEVREIDPEIDFERDPQNRVMVTDTFHPLVALSHDASETMKPDENGIVHVTEPGLIPVEVAQTNLFRAYSILSAVLNAAFDRGYGLSIGMNENRTVYLTVNGERMSVGIGETLDRSERPLTEKQTKEKERSPWLYRYPLYDYTPTGRIKISISAPYSLRCRTTWSDTKRKRLEDSLNSFMISLIKASREIKVIREERERRERAWAEHLRQQEIARKQAEFRKRREEDFVRSIDRWHEAERMRQYLEAVKKRAEAEGIEEDSNFVVWYRWACSRASLLDPLMDGASSDALVPVTLSFWYRWMR